jgi:hypothetical protein
MIVDRRRVLDRPRVSIICFDESGRRLVEDQDVRVVDEGLGEADARL